MASPTTSIRSASSTSGTPTSRRARKHCSFSGCGKVDAGGGFCVAHGGGKKCSYPGCTKGYQTGGYCRKHGGGARCQVPGCTKVDAGKGLCRAHGGGKRCQSSGCPKADVGGGFCTAHGGGKRCSEPGCTKIDQGGGKCRAHGGAKRCKKPNCDQPARGATGLCSDHGGARVCATANCRRLARIGGGEGAFCGNCAKEKQRSTVDSEDVKKPLAFMLAAEQARNSGGDWDAAPTTTTSQTGDNSAGMTNRPYLEEADGAGKTERSSSDGSDKTSRDDLSVTCDGSQIASCLDNGCSRSYGGRCNCLENCTCNHSSPTSSTSLMLGRGATMTIPGAPISQQVDQAAYCGIKRFVLQMQLLERAASSGLPIDAIIAMITALPGVRSTHILPDPSTSQRLDDVVQPSRADESASCLVVVRANGSLDLWASLASLINLELCQVSILEESDLAWTRKEVVLSVEGMMCPGNCGATVMAAVRAVEKVDWAQLAFEARQIIVRGEMHVAELCDAISAVGFDAHAAEVTPLARRFRLRVAELALSSRGEALKQALAHVEGVEDVLLIEPSEALLVATLTDTATLIDAAMRTGFTKFDVSDDCDHSRPTSPLQLDWPSALASSKFADTSRSMRSDSVESDPAHTCDNSVCPQNSCPRYMMTVAHTAALAVGWAVPGCGMANGRECTCGDACKCKGCPEHNPGT